MFESMQLCHFIWRSWAKSKRRLEVVGAGVGYLHHLHPGSKRSTGMLIMLIPPIHQFIVMVFRPIFRLVGGLEHQFYFPIYWVANHPNGLSYFSEGFKPPTSRAILMLANQKPGSSSIDVQIPLCLSGRSGPDPSGKPLRNMDKYGGSQLCVTRSRIL